MSLLILDTTEERMKLSQEIFERQFARDRKMEKEYSNYRKRMMLKDINYNLETLEVAAKLDSDQIISDYARWLFQLLAFRMKDLGEERVRAQMTSHYEILKEVFKEKVQGEEKDKIFRLLDKAIEVTRETPVEYENDEDFSRGKIGRIRERFLQLLLKPDKQEARREIESSLEKGLELEDVYLKIFQRVLLKIGELWHRGKISVAQEHFCTALIQNIMAGLYPRIFSRPRIDRRVLACCIGNELHEMAPRMVCDILEMKGWDSLYLGAGVPRDSLLDSLEEHRPDLLVLSVTMPIYLDQCREVISDLKNREEKLKTLIAVGGRAFSLAPHLPAEWGADVYAQDGIELAEWAKKSLSRSNRLE